MATIRITYNEQSTLARKMIGVLRSSGLFTIKKEADGELKKSLDQARKGGYTVARDAKDAIAQCLK